MASIRLGRLVVLAICLTASLILYLIYRGADLGPKAYLFAAINLGIKKNIGSIMNYSSYDYFSHGSGIPIPWPNAWLNDSKLLYNDPKPQVVFSIGDKPGLVLFSARYDSHLESIVIVGYFNHRVANRPPIVTCRLSLKTANKKIESQHSEANSYTMHEGHSMPYDGVLYFCPIKYFSRLVNNSSKPYHYEVVISAKDAGNRASGSVALPVQFALAKSRSNGVAACITALRFLSEEETEKQFILRLVEFIEVNRLLGIEHFYFYNMSLPSEASRVLKHYIGIGWISVTPWSLAPGVTVKDIHYYGQMVVLNDCLYSVRDKHKLAAFIDIDEFLVPVNAQGDAVSLLDAAKLHRLDDTAGSSCALAFRNGVFPPVPDGGAALKLPDGLAGCKIANLDRRKRIKAVLPFGERSKLLVATRQIKEMGIHFIWNSWVSCQTKQLDPSSGGLLHHMRHWSAGDMVDDLSIKPVQADILNAMLKARNRIKELFNIDFCS